jgi:hypothetical protein
MAKEESTAIVNIAEAMKAELASMAQRVDATPTSFVNLTGKKFTFPDKTEHAGPITCVIIDFINSYSYYDTPYKKGVITEAACHAIGQLTSEMEPLDTSPNKQSAKCSTCPQNQWGSGAGDGKACTNNRILAVVAPDKQDSGEILLIKVSPTGIKHFDKYIASIGTKFQVPAWGVVTEISFSDDTFPSLRFNFVEPNKQDDLMKAYSRKGEALSLLTNA